MLTGTKRPGTLERGQPTTGRHIVSARRCGAEAFSTQPTQSSRLADGASAGFIKEVSLIVKIQSTLQQSFV